MKKMSRMAAVVGTSFAAIAVVATGVAAKDFPAGSKMAELSTSGKIKVGVQTQYPLIGLKSFSGYEGFDVRVAELISQKLGIDKKNIEFVPVTTPTREPFLEQKRVDMIIAAYTITPNRAAVIDFAGPYLPSPSGLLVKKGNPGKIKSMDDLLGKQLCAPTGSNQEAFIAKNFPEVRKTLVMFDSSAKCAQAVLNGQADASTTEIPIMAALAKQNDDQLEIVDFKYDMSLWGVGVTKTEDKAFCKWINATLDELYKEGSWKKAYDETIGTVVPGAPPEPVKTGTTCPN